MRLGFPLDIQLWPGFPQRHGISEYPSGPITLLGGLTKDIREARQFWEVLNSVNCPLCILLTPRLIDIEEMECTLFSSPGPLVPLNMGMFWLIAGMSIHLDPAT